MFLKDRRGRRSRRGVILVLVSLLIVVLCGITGFAVDLGRLAVCKAQLQNAADAAALAGASALGSDNLILSAPYNSQTSDISTARTLSQTFAQSNKYDLNGSRSIVLDKNADVSVGVLTSPIRPSSVFSTPAQGPYNSVQVRTYINSTHGGNLNLLFSPVIGQNSATLQATSVAVVELHTISTLRVISGRNSPILPITMSLSDWNQMVNNLTGVDSLKYDSTLGAVVPGSDGLQEQQLYPGSNGTSSNNGLLQFGTSSHSNSVLSSEILNGPDSGQVLAEWPPNGSPPWSAQGTFTIGADPGWRASNFDDLASAVGKIRIIPINDGTSPGNGANGYYTIVALVPVRIMSSDKGGKNQGSAMVQPAVIIDPSVVASKTLSAPGQGGVPISRLAH
jgi:Flp pilus assembly protein TadG